MIVLYYLSSKTLFAHPTTTIFSQIEREAGWLASWLGAIKQNI